MGHCTLFEILVYGIMIILKKSSKFLVLVATNVILKINTKN